MRRESDHCTCPDGKTGILRQWFRHWRTGRIVYTGKPICLCVKDVK